MIGDALTVVLVISIAVIAASWLVLSSASRDE